MSDPSMGSRYRWKSSAYRDTATGKDYIKLTHPNGAVLVMDEDGKVGVGTATPAEELHIVAPSGGNAAVSLDAAAEGGKEWIIRSQSVGQLQVRNDTSALIPMRIGPTAQAGLLLVGVEPNGSTAVADEVNITGRLTVAGAVKIVEQAAADSDEAGHGQLWVKNTTPCQLWFTDDAGTDTQIV